MANQEQEENDSGEIAGWIVTFSDLMTLLLTFFVLLLSMSSLDRQSISRIFSMLPGKSGMLNRQAWIGNKELPDKEWNYNRLSELMTQVSMIERKRDSEIKPGDIKIIKRNKGFVLIIANNVLFSAGEAVLSNNAKVLLDAVSDFLRQCNNYIAYY
jgi:chemotaxis protein MotB